MLGNNGCIQAVSETTIKEREDCLWKRTQGQSDPSLECGSQLLTYHWETACCTLNGCDGDSSSPASGSDSVWQMCGCTIVYPFASIFKCIKSKHCIGGHGLPIALQWRSSKTSHSRKSSNWQNWLSKISSTEDDCKKCNEWFV